MCIIDVDKYVYVYGMLFFILIQKQENTNIHNILLFKYTT